MLRLWREDALALDPDDLDDVTRFNEAIDELITKACSSFTKKVDQARDMFLAILSHDLRNPLAAIGMTAQVLPLVKGVDYTRKYADQISGNVAVMSKMINDPLDYTRTRLGTGMPVKPQRMDLRELCNDLFEQFRSANPTREVRLHTDGACVGEWDVDRLRQAISNLMGNAIQHGAEDVAVELVLSDAGDEVIVEVCNGGPPISAGDLPRIFDPLIRGADADGPKLTRPGSIGLGLYIAREVARSHAGRIDVTSSVADGTTFALRLPRHPPARLAQPVMNEQQIQRM